jgi:glycosyltransferase domain-containing protein
MRFWANKQVNVLVLDGGDEAMDLPEDIRKAQNIEYLHQPNALNERLAFAAACVTSDYVALCGDDDFHLPSSLDAAIRFLDAHPDYSACGGQMLGFTEPHFLRAMAFEKYELFRELDFSQDDPRDRAIEYFRNYTPATIYSVCRKDVWCDGMMLWGKREFPVYVIGELQFEFNAVYRGKVKRLPMLQWIRSAKLGHGDVHSRRAGKDLSLSKAIRLEKLWGDQNDLGLKTQIVHYMAREISGRTGLVDSTIRHDFNSALSLYVERREKKFQLLHPRDIAERLCAKLRKRFNRLKLPIGLRLALLDRRGVSFDKSEVMDVWRRINET